ncbi:type I polyketide synthase [Amycolatopsis oliviviridis]|uniref:type I polyketide synthase n=1 Tax=Amycolatopsis oliviviridis TaxID=1471590 RepID=UPI00227D9077|nr:type I polyketide synthase [Amycolatopsis oliviviridis]
MLSPVGRPISRSEDLSEYKAPDEAIAIIGMSCRFAPDLDSPEKFWEFLADGKSTVSDMPEKRWKSYAASSPQATAILRGTTIRGSFLDDIEGFDADFFGISPREADFLDPQQRFILELAWEALADAGVPPLSLRNSDAGVFVAANSNDYGRRLLEDIPLTGAYAVNGTTFYGIANRVSYFLDVRGPSMAVDTACAGSLTALHIAAQSLRTGETSIALVGGVNIMATPALNVALEGAGAMSPDGTSKAFDKNADGYGRGEGAGVIVLKLLSDAVRDGDPIQAVIRGSGVFQDGRSEGMMAPNAEAQAHMLREVYERAGVDPSTVDYVEAHGTGTPTGDGEEVEALAAVIGAVRSTENPCLVGSVKPNIGHVEGGSGITGVIKTVLALRNEQIPPSLHTEPNDAISDPASGLKLVGETTPWPAGAGTRRAGVSSYGVGGTIAHVVLEEGPEQPELKRDKGTNDGTRKVFPISAMSEAGLRALAGSVADWIDANPEATLSSIGYTLSQRRSHLPQRGTVIAASTEQLVERLRALAVDEPASGILIARAGQQSDGAVWVFSGHGSQWSGMGRQLLAEHAGFAAIIDSLAGVYREELGWTPREAILDGGPWTAAHVQALTFAMQVGLAEVWRSRGVKPSAIIGHSVGEIAAAVAAGTLDILEAARFACRRAAALQRLEGDGGMVLASLSFTEVQAKLGDRADLVAAISASPTSTVVSGDKAAIAELVTQWREDGIDMRVVDTDIAFHSTHVDAVLEEVAAAARQLNPRTPSVSLYSTALTDPRSGVARDGDYWAGNLRNPVRFAEAVEAAFEDGHRVFVEISSHPVVSHSIIETAESLGIDDLAGCATLRRNTDEVGTLLHNLAKLHVQGVEIDWTRDFAEGDLLGIPAAAWQHKPYWIFPETGADAGLGSGHDPESHSLLGGRMTVSGAPSRQVWQTRLDMDSRPYPQSHGLVGVEVTPAASIINTFALAAEEEVAPALTDIVLRTPLAVQPARIVQIVKEGRSLALATRIADETSADSDEWITHTTATIDTGAKAPEGRIDFATIRDRLPTGSLTKADEMFGRMGVEGYAFPWDMSELYYDDVEQLALMDCVAPPAKLATSWAHVIDAALTISAMVVSPGHATVLWMSRGIEKVAWKGEPPARIIVHATRSPKSPEDTVDVLVANEDGDIISEVIGLKFAAVEHLGTAVLPRDLVHEITWHELPEATLASDLDQIVVVGPPATTGTLVEQFTAAGVTATAVEVAVDGEPLDLTAELFANPGAVVVAPSRAAEGERLEDSTERTTWSLIRTAQRIAELQATSKGKVATQRIWAITSGVRQGTDERSVAHGPLWGVGRIIAGEHPELWGGTIDVEHCTASDLGSRLIEVFRGPAGDEDVISLTGEGAEVARLSQITRSADGSPLHCSPSGTVLITGGLGGLGLEVARWLVDRGARRLLLAGRRGLPPRADWASVTDPDVRHQIDSVLGLEALGVTVGVLALDITDEDAVAEALAPGALGLPPVTGVIHAAGVVNDALVDKVDQDGLRDVFAPKVGGALVLHRLFPAGSLDFFVLFSSCGQFARLSGQASYAAANSFLDALATHRNSGGTSDTISLGWTAWRGVGLSQDIATTMLEANSRGLEAVSASEAFRAWAFGDRFSSDYQAVLRVLPTPPHQRKLPMFRELTVVDESADANAGTGFSVDFANLSEEETREKVTGDVREQVAAELNLEAGDIELKRPLVELGVDSVMTVALRVRLQRRYGLDLPPTILWAKPTVAAVSDHIHTSLAELAEADENQADAA